MLISPLLPIGFPTSPLLTPQGVGATPNSQFLNLPCALAQEPAVALCRAVRVRFIRFGGYGAYDGNGFEVEIDGSVAAHNVSVLGAWGWC